MRLSRVFHCDSWKELPGKCVSNSPLSVRSLTTLLIIHGAIVTATMQIKCYQTIPPMRPMSSQLFLRKMSGIATIIAIAAATAIAVVNATIMHRVSTIQMLPVTNCHAVRPASLVSSSSSSSSSSFICPKSAVTKQHYKETTLEML